MATPLLAPSVVYGGGDSDDDRRDLPITAKDFYKLDNLKKHPAKK